MDVKKELSNEIPEPVINNLIDEKEAEANEEINTTNLEEVYDDKNNFLGYVPTEEELNTLHKVADRLPWAAWSVAAVELCERFTYYGISGPFQNYMQNPRGGLRPGAIDLGQQGASALSYFFQFWCYVTPILGAVVADQFLGKFKTICVFSGIYVVGCLILFLTSLPVAIDHGAALGGLIAAMIIIGLGTGGIKSNVAPLIAEQYTVTKPYVKTLKSGQRVIVDPAATVQSIFMVFYFCINLGSLSAIATTEMELHIDFWAAYLLPFCFFFLGIISLILGHKQYIKKPPTGSVIPNCFKVIWLAASNKFTMDVAKPSYRESAGLSPVVWSDMFVDEVKRALIACKVFVAYPVYWVVYGQMINNFVSQAGTMNTHGIPNDIMQNIDPIAIIVFIPILDRFVYPLLRKWGIAFKPITRIFYGFMFAALAMAYAAIVQHLIYVTGPCYDEPLSCPASEDGTIPNDIHVAVQTPAYVFIALSEIFASITGLEYAYTKAPSSMKSFIMSMFLLTNAFGSALGIALSSTAVDPKLLWMYTGLAIATAIAGIIFWFVFRNLNKVEEELNQMDAEANAEMIQELANERNRQINITKEGENAA